MRCNYFPDLVSRLIVAKPSVDRPGKPPDDPIDRSISAEIDNRLQDRLRLRQDRIFEHRLVSHKRIH
jgi:hypothetical protein